MPTVEISVNGRRHLVQCGEGEEARVRQLASYVDRRVTDLARGQTQVGDARLLLMASLLVADELSDAFDEIKRLKAALDERGRRRRAAGGGGGRAGRAAARRYCGPAGERLTNPVRVLPGALGPQNPGANILCTGAVPAETLVSVLRRPPAKQATEDVATDGHGGPALLTTRRAVRLSHPSDLVRRKAELQRRCWPPRAVATSRDSSIARRQGGHEDPVLRRRRRARRPQGPAAESAGAARARWRSMRWSSTARTPPAASASPPACARSSTPPAPI